MIEKKVEKENGHDDICPLPGAKLCCQLLILVWDFLPSSGSPFIGLFCVKMFSLLLAVTLVSRQSDTRVAERRRQNKVEGSSISAS